VENHLSDQEDWREAHSPPLWVRSVTNKIAALESRLSKYAVDPKTNKEKVLLEEIADLPGEAVLDRRYKERNVKELEAVNGDPDLEEYISARSQNPTWVRDQTWYQLGWDASRGERVDRRFRRLRKKFRETSPGIDRDHYRPRAGISDANCTVFYEELWDEYRGRRSGVWQHRDPDRVETTSEVAHR